MISKNNTLQAQASAAFDRHLGRRLARRRRELEKSAADLDMEISASAGSVARFESGRQSITAAQLFALSRALDVPPPYFFEGLSASSKNPFRDLPSAESIAAAERFLDYYFNIPDARVRRDILGLLKAAANTDGEAA
ncbi:MAG: helix-turn-helix transcriptional regulator [Proteobacteria bacterium]|nr:helix-turn-helix transcriptional regulator [Pseudomonadota bacterium]